MSRVKMAGLILVLAAAAAAGGCTKDVTLTFTNTTDKSRTVLLTTPDGTGEIATLGPVGGRWVHKIKIKTDDLPAVCTFRGGDQSGQFTVNENSEDQLFIDFTPNGPQVRTKKTAIVQTHEKQVGPVTVHQETVVE